MARYPDRDEIYHAAEVFRDKCVSGTGSLNWTGRSPWTEASLAYLWKAFVENPDVSKRTFFEKLKDQLSGANDDAIKVAVDILSFYYLYPDQMTATSKVARLREVAGWNGLGDSLDLTTVEAAYATSGIGHPGTYYNTGLPWNFSFLIGLGRALLQQPDAARDADKLEAITAEVMQKVSSSSTALMRNVSLHLLLPDYFERMGTDRHKNLALVAFPAYDPHSGSVDARLRAVRAGLTKELGRPDFDFYEPMLKARWAPAVEVDPPGPGPGPGPGLEQEPARRVWIEKTIVAGRPDRMQGAHALGRALWSPQRSRGNADIYRTMREVKAGDIVLHLTDNEGFTAISEAAGEADDTFTGVPGTEWGNQPGYRIALTNCESLQPPLKRSVFFSSPFKEQLLAYLEDTDAKLFYSSEPSLNQGAYLTEAPPALIAILNAAYHSVAGEDLLEHFGRAEAPVPTPVREVAAGDFEAACRGFTIALRKCGLEFGNRHESLVRSFFVSLATKRFVILTGLSGSGKTQLAIRFGEWIGIGQSIVVPVRPDWTGAESLFGFEDALQKAVEGRRAWQVPDALQFMLTAAADNTRPYLIVLDEMNLAHVERYFADVLSGMESGKACLPNLAKEADGQWRLKPGVREKIPMPSNLFVVGTVNVDETTYLFSPKVLDRANTFEFRVSTADLRPLASQPTACASGTTSDVTAFLAVASDAQWHLEHRAVDDVLFGGALTNLHRILAESGHEFGHRTMMEAMRFAVLLHAAGDTDIWSAVDLQVMQKILPRLHGSRRRLEPVLARIGRYCVDPIDGNLFDTPGQSAEFDPLQLLAAPAKLPIAFDKVRRMTALLRANQFVSFTE